MLTTLGMILLALTGLSAAFIFFVFLFGDAGTLVNIKATVGTTTTAATGSPFSLPYTILAADTGATGALITGNKIDVTLTTLGNVFIYGGMAVATIFALMLPFAPWSILDREKVCCACKQPEVAPSCGCAA